MTVNCVVNHESVESQPIQKDVLKFGQKFGKTLKVYIYWPKNSSKDKNYDYKVDFHITEFVRVKCKSVHGFHNSTVV